MGAGLSLLSEQDFPGSTGPGNPEAAEQESSKTNPTLKKCPSAPELGKSPAQVLLALKWECQPCPTQHPQGCQAWAEGTGEGQSGNPDKGLSAGVWVIPRKPQHRAGLCLQGVPLPTAGTSLPTLCLQNSSCKHLANAGRAEMWFLVPCHPCCSFVPRLAWAFSTLSFLLWMPV